MKLNSSRPFLWKLSLSATLIFSYPSLAYCLPQEAFGPPSPNVGMERSSDETSSEDTYRLESFAERAKRRKVENLEISYQILNALDAAQTISCVSKQYCKEGSMILGKKPSILGIVGFKAASGIIHFGIERFLIRRNLREAMKFEIVSVTVQGVICGLNFRYAF